MILIFGAGFRMASGDGATPWRGLPRSFVAGLHERSVLVASDGDVRCLQIDLAPPGARRLFGVDQDALCNRVVDLADLIGTEAERLADRLAGAADWPAQFGLVEAWLAVRLAAAPTLPPEIGAA